MSPRRRPGLADELAAHRARERADGIEDITWMASHGETLAGAAKRLGIKRDSLIERLKRWERTDLIDRLRINAGEELPERRSA